MMQVAHKGKTRQASRISDQAPAVSRINLDELMIQHGQEIAQRLNNLRQLQLSYRASLPPAGWKLLRDFSLGEAAAFLGVSPSNLKKLHLDLKGPQPQVHPNGRRSYSAQNISDLRAYLSRHGRAESKQYDPSRRDGDALQVIAVTNCTSGSGKTALSAHLVQYLALSGHRVLAIDLDPQASLTRLFGILPDHEAETLFASNNFGSEPEASAALEQALVQTAFPGLALLPASAKLHEAERQLLAQVHRPEPPSGGDAIWHRLTKAIQLLDPGFDVVVIDCPPRMGVATISALFAATAVLIPVNPTMAGMAELANYQTILGQTLRELRLPDNGADLDWLKYVVTMDDPTDMAQSQITGFMQALLTGQLLKASFTHSPVIAGAMASNRTIYEVMAGEIDRGSHARAMNCLTEVNEEITRNLHQAWGRSR